MADFREDQASGDDVVNAAADSKEEGLRQIDPRVLNRLAEEEIPEDQKPFYDGELMGAD